MKEKKNVYKPPAVIHHDNRKVSLLQKKTWSWLVANAYDELETEEIYSVSVRELMQVLGFNSHNQEYLKDALRDMMTTLVEWDILRHDKKNVWQAATMLSGVRIEDGICYYGFDAMFRQALYHPAIYARLSLALISKFSSKYALTLWEMCQHAMNPKTGIGETQWITLDEFRKMMGVKESTYKDFRNLKKRVIQTAIEEVKLLAHSNVTPEYRRKGRKITQIKFKVARGKAIEAESGQEVLPFEMEELPELVTELRQAGVSKNAALEIWEQGFDYIGTDAQLPSRADFETYVREKIDLAKRSRRVENKGGFLVQAIKENWANPEFEQKDRKAKIAELEQKKEALDTEWQDKRRGLLEQLVRENPDAIQEAVEVLKTKTGYGYAIERLALHDSVLEACEQEVMVRASIAPILCEMFPGGFKALDGAYEEQIAGVDEEIMGLRG